MVTKMQTKRKKNSRFKEFIDNLKPMRVNSKMIKPVYLILLFNIFGFFLALGSNEKGLDPKALAYFLFATILMFLANKYVTKITKGDGYILQIACMLFSIGVIVIYRLNPYEGLKQIMWFTIGILLFFGTFFILKSYKKWYKFTALYLIGCVVMFLMTLVLAEDKYGARNWISIFGVGFQPSEITKILYVFFLASYDYNTDLLDKINIKSAQKYKKYLPIIKRYFLMIVVYLFIGMFFLQKDLGTAMIFYGLFLVYQIVNQEDIRLILLNLLIAIAGAVAAYMLFSHIRIRVSTWLDPWKNIDGIGYQITQALFAIASGGFFGTGLGLGRPDVVPVVTSDFIFAAICEEMGTFTGMGVIMLFLILIYRGMKISLYQSNKFYKIVALGISVIFAIQGLVMFGGVMKLVPLTGITIPFVSYGGTSMAMSFICLAILQFCSTDQGEEDIYAK